MAERANVELSNALIRPFSKFSGNLKVGFPVKLVTDDFTIADTGAGGADAIGVVLPHDRAAADGTITVATLPVNEPVRVALYCHIVAKMRVGTGGVTRSKRVKVVADGVTDAPAAGGGNVAVETVGFALQTGALGDFVGIGISPQVIHTA